MLHPPLRFPDTMTHISHDQASAPRPHAGNGSGTLAHDSPPHPFDIETFSPDQALAALEQARQQGTADQLGYAGQVSPALAWALAGYELATLVDVRSNEERVFVGHVAVGEHVAWASGTALTRNPRFVRELEARTGKDHVLLLLCRSGNRSADAALAATRAGFSQVFNILEGFEGQRDASHRRGRINGWRLRGLPWVQS